jgi:hydroxymethylglutaryl-CoA lyase
MKLALIEDLIEAGVGKIQVASFVHPEYVPQMADAEAVCARLPRRSSVEYRGLVLNKKGLERARAAGLSSVDISVSASDTHSRRNVNRSLSQALDDFATMVALAQQSGMRVRGGIQCAFGCAYEGPVDSERVIEIVKHHLALGVDELALADSTGMANPRQVYELMQMIMPMLGSKPLILHLHDTRGLGLANLLAALACNVAYYDTAFGGLGGCPFIEGSAGNIGTEDALYLLEQMGIETDVDRHKVAQCSRKLEEFLGKPLPGKMYRAELDRPFLDAA